MNFTWFSNSNLPEQLNSLKNLSLNVHALSENKNNEILDEDIKIIPISELEASLTKEGDYFLWMNLDEEISADLYQQHKESSRFLGTLGAFLEEQQIFGILKSAQNRKIKNLRQAEIIQKAKSQHLLIENQVKNLNSEVEQKTRQLFEYRDELESQVAFEKASILILKNLLEASSFESFARIIINSFKGFYVQNLIIFYKTYDGTYRIQSPTARIKKLVFSKQEVLKIDKNVWANINSKPILEFKLFPIGNNSEYFIGFEFSGFNLNFFNLIQRHINYLQYIFKMVLDYLFDQEKIISDSQLWSNSFNSLDDPLLIVDEYYKVVKSNLEPEVNGQNCFKVLFNRDKPCENCPILQSQRNKISEPQKASLNLDDKYNLHSFPVETSEDFEQKLWIHHYESTASINELRTQYIKSEKFSYLGQLVDKVIHQIANPLTGMRSSVEFMLDDLREEPDSSLKEDLIEIQSGLMRCFDIIYNLKQFSASEMTFSEIDLSSFVTKTLTLMKSVTRDIRFELEGLEKKTIKSPMGLVQQVLFNLIYNSCQAMNFSGQIKIYATVDSKYTNLVVADSGPGISPNISEKIFDPFFSTKSKDQGTGIGLFLSRQIIRQFGGDIVVMENLSPGAQLCIKFPLRVE